MLLSHLFECKIPPYNWVVKYYEEKKFLAKNICFGGKSERVDGDESFLCVFLFKSGDNDIIYGTFSGDILL